MFPRRICARCGRSITVNRDGELRSHFCPHYVICERDQCVECQAQRLSREDTDAETTDEPTQT